MGALVVGTPIAPHTVEYVAKDMGWVLQLPADLCQRRWCSVNIMGHETCMKLCPLRLRNFPRAESANIESIEGLTKKENR